VTVLFTDLVGSTELAWALTPEAGDELRRAHFSLLRQAIAAAGGTEVKNLGDGLMVVFPAASAALSCAVAMQQAVDRDNRRAPRPLGLRVGLSAGEATSESGDYFGDPVIEAARLCARAEGGQILAADLVRANAGRRNPHSFSSLGDLELKGLPERIQTLEIAWEALGEDIDAATSVVPLPSRLEVGPATGVVAREVEAALLNDAFKRVANAEGHEVVLVSGDAGLGKTTLVAEAARKAASAGACVLLGRCQEELSASYAPFVEVLHHYVTNASEEVLRAHVAAHGGDLARMVPALRQRLGEIPEPTSADPDTERYLLYGAVVGLLTLASQVRPVVLVLEDLHWSDTPSLQLLRHVVANVESARVLVLGTFRDSEVSASHPLTEVLGALRREAGVHRIELKGFDDTGVLAFMEALAGHQLGDIVIDLVRAVYRETDGNPFFVVEVLRNLTETGAIAQDDAGRWSATQDLSEMALPTSVREVIGARVARLGERASQMLSVAAVIGREFDFELLDAVSDLSADDLLDLLDAAAAAALVRELTDVPGRWSFSHALTQHTLYQDLGATRRARAHRQVAEALESLCGEHPGTRVGELAHHWFSATQPVNTAKAISYARQAAEAALTALAPDDAVHYYSQALQLVALTPSTDPLLDCDLRIGRGVAQRQAGIAAYRETFLEAASRAQAIGATDRLVQAVLANTRGFMSNAGAIDTDKVATLEAALTALPEADSTERALLLATLCSELLAPLEELKRLADDARAMARRIGDPASLMRVLYLVGNPIMVPSLLGERVADTAEALAIAETLGEPALLHGACAYAVTTAMQSGDFEEADRCLELMHTLSARLQQPALTWMSTFISAAAAIRRGDHERSEQGAEAALRIGTESGQPDAFLFYGAQIIPSRLQQGTLGELRPMVEAAVVDNPGLPGIRAWLAVADLEAGDTERALQLIQAESADAFASVPYDLLWLTSLSSFAGVVIELHAAVPAQQLFELLKPYHEQIPAGSLGCSPPVACYLGGLASVLGRYDEAENYFIEATDLNTRGGMKFAAAWTQLLWGRMRAVRSSPGDTERARELLTSAQTAAAAHGYANIKRRATEALERSTEPGRSGPTGVP
jgi:class 3 adenylate cyclase